MYYKLTINWKEVRSYLDLLIVVSEVLLGILRIHPEEVIPLAALQLMEGPQGIATCLKCGSLYS